MCMLCIYKNIVILIKTMSRGNDEFNYVKITNEEEVTSFEYGSTPDEETASYKDNRDQINDEVNDNPSSNDENISPEKKEKRRKEEQKEKEGSDKSSKDSGGSSGSGGSAASAGGITAASAAVVAAISIVTGIVSVGAGLSPEVDNVKLTPHETSINCDFDIFNSDSTIKYKVELYNNELDHHFGKESQIGHNELEFEDLKSSTEYTFEILRGKPGEQEEYSFESIYSEFVTTLDVPYSDSVTLSFDAKNRGGTMGSIEVPAGSEYSLPVSIFVPFDDEYFGGWKVNGEGQVRQPGETIIVNSETTLVAEWTKFPTKENTVTASTDFFTFFPEQASEVVSSVRIMGVDFQFKNTSFYSSVESLSIANDGEGNGGFVSTSSPFGGPISKITVNTAEVALPDDVNYTMVYSASPIYEKVTEGGETHALGAGSTYTFECTNPDARYFCLSVGDNSAGLISSMEFVYNTPKIENEFKIYFDANGGTGSFGPYTVRNLNKRDLPSAEDIGFGAPDGYEFAGWKVQSVEDLLEAGTVIGISSDITLVAQWQPKPQYTVTFVSDGGSPVDSQTVIRGECAVKPDDPAKDTYLFMDWYTDEQAIEPYDFSEPITGNLTLIARWKPDVDFSMNINYIDTLSADRSNVLSFKYSKNDQYSHYVDFNLVLDGTSGDTISLEVGALANADTDTTITTSISTAAASALGTGIINYTMNGITSSGDAYVVATGSLSMSRSQKDHFLFAYIGEELLESDRTEAYHATYVATSYYLPIRLDLADYDKAHRDLKLAYTTATQTTETYASFTYTNNGCLNVYIGSSNFDEDKQATFLTMRFLYVKSNPTGDQYIQISDSYTNVTVQATEDRYLGGFQLRNMFAEDDETYDSKKRSIMLSACGDNTETGECYSFTSLGVNNDNFEASLTFRMLDGGGFIEKDYVIDLTSAFKDSASSSMSTTYVNFNIIDSRSGENVREEFIEYAKRYVVDVELTVKPGDGSTFTRTSYESYSFR